MGLASRSALYLVNIIWGNEEIWEKLIGRTDHRSETKALGGRHMENQTVRSEAGLYCAGVRFLIWRGRGT